MRTLNIGNGLRTMAVGGLAALAIASCGAPSRDTVQHESATLRTVQEQRDDLQLRVDITQSAYQRANMNAIEMLRMHAKKDDAVLFAGYERVSYPFPNAIVMQGLEKMYQDSEPVLLVVECSLASDKSHSRSLYYDGSDPKTADVWNLLVTNTIGDTLKFGDWGYISGIGHSGKRVLKSHAESL